MRKYNVYIPPKDGEWFELVVVSIDEEKDFDEKHKVVFSAKSEESGNVNQCVYWGHTQLKINDKINVFLKKIKDGIYLCKRMTIM